MGSSGARRRSAPSTTTTATVLPVFLTGGLTVQISAELGFDPAGLGLVVALYFGISALASLPCGWLVERFGAGPTSRVGGARRRLLDARRSPRSPGSFPALVVILLCGAWCNVLGQLSSNLTLARYVPATRLGLSFGIKQAAIPVATLLAGLAVPAVALTVGWRWAYVIGAGLALGALLLAPRDAGGRERSSAAPGERATGALSVIGLAAGLAAGAASALGIFLVASAVDRGVERGSRRAHADVGQRRRACSLRLVNGWLADRRVGRTHRGRRREPDARRGRARAARRARHVRARGRHGTRPSGSAGRGRGCCSSRWCGCNPSAPAAATSIVQVGVYGGGCVGPIAFGFLAAHASFPAAWLVGGGRDAGGRGPDGARQADADGPSQDHYGHTTRAPRRVIAPSSTAALRAEPPRADRER